MVVYSEHERRPILNSEVFVLGGAKNPAQPPPSPPTPSLSPPEGIATQDIPPEDLNFFLDNKVSPSPLASSSHSLAICPTKRKTFLRDGIHVLNTEAQAMANLKRVYEQDAVAREGFARSVETICRQTARKSKLVIVGVGKSGHIGKKMTATFQSLGVRAAFLHPTEALHGDLGFVDAEDTIMFVTYSGKTQELMLLLPHLHEEQAIIVLTSHTRAEMCEITRQRPGAILLPAPVLESEKASFGVSAPTTSTTISLALGDALAVAVSNELHTCVPTVFAKNHPGGAIGAAHKAPSKLEDICTLWKEIPAVGGLTKESVGLDLFRAGYSASSEWIRVEDAITSRRKVGQLTPADLTMPVGKLDSSLFISQHDLILLPSHQDIQMAANTLRELLLGREEGEDVGFAVGLMKGGELHGVVETSRVLQYQQQSRNLV